MVRRIIKDGAFLAQESEDASRDDISTAIDLLDTLKAHSHHCVGLAANMIGESKRIIAVNADENYIAMLNPEMVKKSAKRFKATEGCLSLEGEREAERHDWIEVKYRDLDFKKQRQKFSGFAAQIIQHEIDHCNGILI